MKLPMARGDEEATSWSTAEQSQAEVSRRETSRPVFYLYFSFKGWPAQCRAHCGLRALQVLSALGLHDMLDLRAQRPSW